MKNIHNTVISNMVECYLYNWYFCYYSRHSRLL